MARPLSNHAVSVLQFFGQAPATMADAAKVLSLTISVITKILVRLVESGRLRIVRRERMPHCKKPVCFYAASGLHDEQQLEQSPQKHHQEFKGIFKHRGYQVGQSEKNINQQSGYCAQQKHRQKVF